jgi:hypothetical protein
MLPTAGIPDCRFSSVINKSVLIFVLTNDAAGLTAFGRLL